MSQAGNVLARKEGAIGTLIFNNPEKHNAVSLEMWESAARILDECKKDSSVRVVVVTGAGERAFISGADISRFGEERADEAAAERYSAAVERVCDTLYTFPKPTLAMIRGYCLGGGVAVAVCCDLRIASVGARFGIPAAKLGLGYGYLGIKRLVDLIGPAFTKEIFFTARHFTAAEVVAMGLVNRVVADAELEAFVENYAETIASNAPLTVHAAKRAIGDTVKDEAERDLAAIEALVKACFASEDYAEGRAAFLEKRKPRFKGK